MQKFGFTLLDGRKCVLTAEYHAKMENEEYDADGVKVSLGDKFVSQGELALYVDDEYINTFPATMNWKGIKQNEDGEWCLYLGHILLPGSDMPTLRSYPGCTVIRFPDRETTDKYIEWISSVMDDGASKSARSYLLQKQEEEKKEKKNKFRKKSENPDGKSSRHTALRNRTAGKKGSTDFLIGSTAIHLQEILSG